MELGSLPSESLREEKPATCLGRVSSKNNCAPTALELNSGVTGQAPGSLCPGKKSQSYSISTDPVHNRT